MASRRINITVPPEWHDAWRAQAKAEGMTLSAWIGECCNAYLKAEVANALSERPPANRPKKDAVSE